MPSSRATPAWVAIPPLLLFLNQNINPWTCMANSYGFKHGEGFLVSSIRPAMFLRNKLCMFFSSISRSLMPGWLSFCPRVIFRSISYLFNVYDWLLLMRLHLDGRRWSEGQFYSALAHQHMGWIFTREDKIVKKINFAEIKIFIWNLFHNLPFIKFA